MTVIVRKTITENVGKKRRDSSSPTGWVEPTGEKIRRDPSKPGVAVMRPAPAPRTVPYEEKGSYGIVGGTVHTIVSVDEPITLTLDPREAEVVISALLSSRMFTTGINLGPDGRQPSPEQIERSIRLNDVFEKIGVPKDFIVNEY